MTIGRAVFEAGLPVGDKGKPVPGHTEWEQLGPKSRERYERMAQAAITAQHAIDGALHTV